MGRITGLLAQALICLLLVGNVLCASTSSSESSSHSTSRTTSRRSSSSSASSSASKSSSSSRSDRSSRTSATEISYTSVVWYTGTYTSLPSGLSLPSSLSARATSVPTSDLGPSLYVSTAPLPTTSMINTNTTTSGNTSLHSTSSGTATASATSSIRAYPTVCNGYEALCDRNYSNITYIGAHNSYGVGVNNPSANQVYNVSTQLVNGIRLLQGQAHPYNGGIHLCHTSCSLLDGGSLASYLSKVHEFLEANPNEFVTLLWVNSGVDSVEKFAKAYQASGMKAKSWVPPQAKLAYDEWPTLGELLQNGTQAITFMDTGADFDTVPYIMDEFSNVWETPYDQTSQDFECEFDRPKGKSDKYYNNIMYLANHYLDVAISGTDVVIPDVREINVTNALNGYGSAGQGLTNCQKKHSRNPTFILADYYNYADGDLFRVEALANGLSYEYRKMGNGQNIYTSEPSLIDQAIYLAAYSSAEDDESLAVRAAPPSATLLALVAAAAAACMLGPRRPRYLAW